MIASVTSLLAGHLAAGGLFVSAALALGNKLPIGFLRFCSLAAAVTAALAALLDPEPSRWAWFGTSLLGGLWYGLLRRDLGASKAVAGIVATGAIVGLVAFASLGTEPPLVSVSGSVASALLLGAVTVTMILGHWYLVDTSLSIAPLRDGARWFWIAVAARWIVVGVLLAAGGWEVLRVSRAADLIWSDNGLFFLFRSLMGLMAPLLLSVLVWQTVKIRSTQSATGLLYVALILVLFGELCSSFLRVRTGFFL